MEFILASQSPRRREILSDAGFNFKVLTVEISETFNENLNLDEQIIGVAQTKGEAIARTIKPSKSNEILILSADTVVVLQHEKFGKPKDQNEAKQILLKLRGQTHSVKTGVCFIHLPTFQIYTGIDTSTVSFKNFSESELENYLQTKEWADKAGAYGIQGAAAKLVESHKGSLTNIIGLPIELVQSMMEKHGWYKRCR
jgi:septum formation protein